LAVKNNKHDPVSLGDGISMYADNALIELSMPPTRNIKTTLLQMKDAFGRMQKALGYKFNIVPQSSHLFERDELADKSLWESGCNPSYNAYTGLPNPPAEFKDGLRTGSFHVHIGHPQLDNVDIKLEVIRLLDVYLGLSSVVFDTDKTAPARRKLYGRAGEFRPTPYGVEYRVLGNWALRSPMTTELVYDIVLYCIDIMERGQMANVLGAIDPIPVQMAINEYDNEWAVDLLQKAGIPWRLLDRVQARYNTNFYRDWGVSML
jgi:hypothetical protein